MARATPLTSEEQQIIEKLRWLRKTYANFKLVIYGQGSAARRVLDLEWSPRIRLEQREPLSLAVDD